MTNDELVKKVKELLNADADLGKLVACITGSLDRVSGEKGHRTTQG